jgi:hypothetical protein
MTRKGKINWWDLSRGVSHQKWGRIMQRCRRSWNSWTLTTTLPSSSVFWKRHASSSSTGDTTIRSSR